MNEEIKKQLKRYHEEEIITSVRYTKEKLRFEAKYGSCENFIKTFLYRNFPHKLIKYDNMYLELLKYPEEWISSEVNQ